MIVGPKIGPPIITAHVRIFLFSSDIGVVGLSKTASANLQTSLTSSCKLAIVKNF